ncbi:hypothetical protein SteCoe_12469 [Stentor coeruleus]|uniref:Major facilitator superfamily (MFS) profile domain-containing protein n=1 Tax=Stentor coeruleus TaxID=5963 RepID=A0A1R2CAT3_9CILI|nr:hypothetical protein SteCoe_12469 [Stentor coeruleus]
MANNWLTLAGLIGIAMASQAVRFCISYISAGSDLLSDTNTNNEEYGFITGPGFLLVYALVTMPMGKLIDRMKTLKWFILINSIGNAIAISLNALAIAFWGILYPRCMLAIFSTGLDPASMKMISVSFPPGQRGMAYGFYLAAVYVGSSLASLTLLISSMIGWRLTFLVSGIFTGILTVVGIFTIQNLSMPTKNSMITVQEYTKPEKSDWKVLFHNRTIVFTLIGTFFRYSAGFARGYYEALYFSNEFSDNKNIYSIINALALLVTPINLALAGKFSDYKEEHLQPHYRPILCSVTNLISVPFLITMYLTSSFPLSMTCLFIVYAFGETYISISVTMMINVTQPQYRGLQTALLFCVSFIGGTISTVSLGFLNESHEMLRISLLCFVGFGYLIAGLLFIVTIFSYPKDLRKFEEDSKSTISL